MTVIDITKIDIKPSELPTASVIVEIGHGMWIKDSYGYWTEIHPKNPEFALTVSDKGFVKPSNGYWGKDFPQNPVEKPADEFFGEFVVLAAPVGWVPPKPKGHEFKWWPIPGHPTYVIREDGIKIRNVKYGNKKAKNKAKSGYFVLYSGGDQQYWHENKLGNEEQQAHFFKTGALHPDVAGAEIEADYSERKTA
jgi:hypothetical protein